MATEPGKNTSPGAALPRPRQIPLADISDLPGAARTANISFWQAGAAANRQKPAVRARLSTVHA